MMADTKQRPDAQPWNQFSIRFIILLVLVLIILLLARSCIVPPSPPVHPSPPPVGDHTSTPTVTGTLTPTPTNTTTPAGLRPIVVVAAYGTIPDPVDPGKEFTLELRIVNQGQTVARDIILTIPAGNFIPLETGGVFSISELASGEKQAFTQPLVASDSLPGSSVSTLEAQINYTDVQGQAFREAFTLALHLATTIDNDPTDTVTPTITPAATRRPCKGFGRERGAFWIVAGCDTLTRISRVTGISLERLLAANPAIKDPDLIYPNQMIRLPGR